MKKVLLYYPFTLAENPNSGSQLRPHEILRAFRSWGEKQGIKILLISGSSIEREQQFNQMKQSNEFNDLLFCYMENQTIPLWLTDAGHVPKKPFVDRAVLSFLKKNSVPVGVFYRDVYWKFDELYPLKGVKKRIMQSIYRVEEKFYEKYCDVIFLPSDAMGKFVDINREKIALPPGGKKKELELRSEQHQPTKGIYVGGINSKDYGLSLLLDALKQANQEAVVSELTVVCREKEYTSLPQEEKAHLDSLGVKVHHLSGAALDELYKEMDYAYIPRHKSTYNDFSVPVKLVEYLSNGLPIVATDCDAQKALIEGDEYGIICTDNATDMARAIKDMAGSYPRYKENIQQTFIDKHSWEARVRKIAASLLKEEL